MSRLCAQRIARRFLRRLAGTPERALPVRVVPGDAEPMVRGTGWHYETRGGSWIYHPSAYSRRGWSNMVYCHSTRRVEVGVDKVIALARENSEFGRAAVLAELLA